MRQQGQRRTGGPDFDKSSGGAARDLRITRRELSRYRLRRVGADALPQEFRAPSISSQAASDLVRLPIEPSGMLLSTKIQDLQFVSN